LDLNTYQEKAMGTAVYGAHQATDISALTYAVLALCGETGELANKLKKHLRAGTKPDNAILMDELSDCLWYVAATAKELGYTLDEVGIFNIEKLRKRYEEKRKAVS
jgi:NTP pyrophosphatase (non-canonical NTP hydrolase)